MADVKGGDISAYKSIFAKFSILDELLLSKQRPKLGIQIYNAGDDNHSCHILAFFKIESIGCRFQSKYLQ